jgi:hypothetical protein
VVHGVIDENCWFVSFGTDCYEPPLLGNRDGCETAVSFLSHKVVLFFRLRVVFHYVVTSRVSDFILVDEMDVVADRRVHSEHESGF